MLSKLKKELKGKADVKRAKILQRFFKTGPGEYGQGDVFLGIAVPEIRKTIRKYGFLLTEDAVKLLHSKIHEERFAALLVMINKFQAGNEKEKAEIFKIYLKNVKYINNWDLVDLSADKIAGAYLFDKPKNILYGLAESKNVWERRMAIMATFNFIKKNRFEDTLKISKMLLADEHDLVRKAIGWMLREIGKRDLKTEEDFLWRYRKRMARITLCYAIEKFSKEKKERYLSD